MSDELAVWYGTRRAGVLRQTVDGIEFEYDPEWLSGGGVPLSHSLPLASGRLCGRAPTAFFENLLPEGSIRAAVARAVGTDEGNEFRLLEEIGAECAGALSILPPGASPAAHPDPAGLTPLDNVDLERILGSLPQTKLVHGPDGLAPFSLAGAQDKLVLTRRANGTWALPAAGVPSTHIVKTAIAGLDDTVANEAFVLDLARSVGLPAAACEVLRFGRVEALAVTRFDRGVAPDGTIRRMHQEDICQAVGIPSRAKYERDGGPGTVDCIELVREVSAVPARDVTAFVRLFAFNALVGNADAHGKNYSLLLGPGGVRLAPAYDLVCTVAYQHARIDPRLAMRIGGKDKIWSTYPSDWRQLAEGAAIGPGALRRLVLDLATRLPDAAARLREERIQRGSHRPVVDRIVDLVTSSCRHVRETFAA